VGATAFTSNDGNDYVALAPQSGVGAAVTSTAAYTFFKWLDGTSTVQHDRAMTTEGGDGQDQALAYIEHHTGGANVVAYGRPDSAVRLIGWAFGAGTITGTVGGKYTHTLWPANQARLLTFEAAAPGQSVIEQLFDSKVKELTIEAEHGKPVKVTAAITGGDSPRSIARASARTVSLESGEPFYFNLGSYQFSVAGTPVAEDEITKMTVTYTRTQDESVFGVGYGRKAITDLNRDVTVEFTRRYTNPSMHNAVLYGAAGGSIVTPAVATGTLDMIVSNGLTGASARSIRLAVPGVVWQPLARNVLEVDGQTVYEDFAGVGLKMGTHLAWAQVECGVASFVASGAL
jgi:hypothetical protein